jgi:formyl-CoA transferase
MPDLTREWGPVRYKGRTLLWPIQSRNQKCITLNLREPQGQRHLVAAGQPERRITGKFPSRNVGEQSAGARIGPGGQTLEKWNLGWDRLRAANPALIMTRVSGFGQTGPYQDRAGFGSVGEAIGGIRFLTGEPGRQPVRTRVSLGILWPRCSRRSEPWRRWSTAALPEEGR